MDQIYPRELEATIEKYLHRKEIIGLRGARQTGKTTILKMLEKKLSGQKVFINCDLSENRRALQESPLDFVQRWKKDGEKLTLFFDEIQRVQDAGEKLKIIFDEDQEVKMLFSGSSSLEIKTKVLPALVGRLLLFEVYTFDFEEYLYTLDVGLWKLQQEMRAAVQRFLAKGGTIKKPSFEREFLKHWKNYVLFGGYPEVVKARDEEEKKLILKNIYNLYLEKDIVAFFKIEDASKFEDFLKSLAFTAGQLLNLASFSQELNLPYQKTKEYFSILQHTYILSQIKPYHRNLVSELKKSPKHYFLDLGLRNVMLQNFLPFDQRTDTGAILENAVFRQLLSQFPDYKINFWRTTGKAEVDFVLTKGDEIIPVEVKLSGKKLGKSFFSFLYAYKPKKALCVTLNHFERQEINGTAVYWVPVFCL